MLGLLINNKNVYCMLNAYHVPGHIQDTFKPVFPLILTIQKKKKKNSYNPTRQKVHFFSMTQGS